MVMFLCNINVKTIIFLIDNNLKWEYSVIFSIDNLKWEQLLPDL